MECRAVFEFLDRLVASQVPIQQHIADDVWLLDDGSLVALLELLGVTGDADAILGWKTHLNRVYKNLADDCLILSVYDCRTVAPASATAIPVAAPFRTTFAANLDASYRRNLVARGLYLNRLFLAVQVRPPRYEGEFLAEQFEIRRSKPTPIGDVPASRRQHLEDVCALLGIELRAYRPRRLGVRINPDGVVFSAMGEALLFALTGIWRSVPLTTGRLGEALFSEQLVFHRETIEFVAPGCSHFAAGFGMKHFPTPTFPTMFRRLLSSNYRRTVFHTFRFIKTADAQTIMRRKHFRMTQAEDPAVSQAEALKQAADNLQSAEWVFGDYGFTMLVFADSLASLTDACTAAWSDLAESGMVGARETRALEPRFYSLVPGNLRLRPRPGYISSLNFASLASLHAFPHSSTIGYWGPPAALFTTIGRTLYYYHFHVGDVGNTFVCGRTGSGKSTLLAFLICQAERYDATVIVFDYRRGLKILCRALAGSYAELHSDLAPLKALSSSDDDRAFLVKLIRSCILADGGPDARLTAEEDRRLNLAVNIVMTMPPADRSLHEIRAFLGSASINPDCAGARLEKWCAGNELGWILDNDHDSISLDAKVIGFDQTRILNDPHARGPVIAVLYHYASRLIDGRKLLFVIDEFWKSLLDPTFKALVQEGLRTIRKENAAMILATQSPRDGLVSDIRHVLRDQCPSQFYFANKQASWDDFGDAGMGLTRTEFDIVRALTPGSGEFLLKQDSVSSQLTLPLGNLDDELAVLSGREENTRIFDAVEAEADARAQALLRTFHAVRKGEMAL
jgi:type IV secretion system protein VirB4